MRASGFCHLNVVGTDELADASHGRHLAHFGHGRQAARELGYDFFFVAAQHVDVDFGFTKLDAQSAQVAHFIHDSGHVQQRLAGNMQPTFRQTPASWA